MSPLCFAWVKSAYNSGNQTCVVLVLIGYKVRNIQCLSYLPGDAILLGAWGGLVVGARASPQMPIDTPIDSNTSQNKQ